MSSFEPRRSSTAPALFLPLSGPPVEEPGAHPVSSIFAELVERSQRPLQDAEPEDLPADDGPSAHAEAEPAAMAEADVDTDPQPAASEAGPSAEELAALDAELHAAYERGLRDAREAIDAQYGDVAKGFADALGELVKARAETRTRHHRALVHVAFQAARKIVGEELEQAPERWLPMIRDGVHRTLDRETIVVRVGVSLHAYLTQHLDELRAQLEEVRDLELAEDPALPQNGCVIETAYGDLDLSPESQLDALEESVKEPR